MSSIETPIGPVPLNREARPAARRARSGSFLDLALVVLAFGFVVALTLAPVLTPAVQPASSVVHAE
ncbi:hypothetical protein [Chthonobacter rhizosphaerae]|uniref:hypothetical protein n=1 Tax=Chthonobacter rhizosphaerae TaxID=2735553 RepID=UPI0015EE5CD6|nr:hypothetical protein [Chthonobacter rhizosphaerae]